MKLTGSSTIPQELGIRCFSKWILLKVTVNITYLVFLFQFFITSQTSLTRLTEDSIKINNYELQYPYSPKPVFSTVNLTSAGPNEVQKFINKLPDYVKGKNGIISFSF